MMRRPTRARRSFLKAMAGIVVAYPPSLRADQADAFRTRSTLTTLYCT